MTVVQIFGGLVTLAAVIGAMIVIRDDLKRQADNEHQERMARIEANERCYKLETWRCYMDEKIRREKAEKKAAELQRKLGRAKDQMAKVKLKRDI